MSTTARKARKRAGIPFQHPVKIGTPVKERSVSRNSTGKFDWAAVGRAAAVRAWVRAVGA